MDARDLYRLEFCQQCKEPCKQEGIPLKNCLDRKLTELITEKKELKKESTTT